MTDTAPALPAGPDPRPRSQFVATGFAVAAGMMMFAGGLGTYMARRHASGPNPGSDWIPDGVLVPNPQFDYALLTLGISLLAAHWAVYSSRRAERGNTWLAILITLFMGLAFINMAIHSLNRMDLAAGSGEYANLALALFGLGIAVAVIGLFYIGLMAIRSLGGSLGRDGTAPLSAAVFFWDFAAVAWTATWYVVFVVK